MKPCFSPSCDHSCMKLAASQKIFYKKQTRWLSDKLLLNSVITKYCDLSVSHRSIIATDKTQYFAQPRPITVNCHVYTCKN